MSLRAAAAKAAAARTARHPPGPRPGAGCLAASSLREDLTLSLSN